MRKMGDEIITNGVVCSEVESEFLFPIKVK